jgi:hypothetical protein
MPKLKQNISGCSRREEGATRVTTIHFYISTLLKQSADVLDIKSIALHGNPPMPVFG